MRRTINFILILIISSLASVQACGPYYPYGEAVRYSIMEPAVFDFENFSGFQYQATSLSPMNDAELRQSMNANLTLWQNRCKEKPSLEAVAEAVYGLSSLNDALASQNAFYQALKTQGDAEAIRYLNFAKKAALFNQTFGDPWERSFGAADIPKRKNMIDHALDYGIKLSDEDLRTRYAFIAIRLAYYHNDPKIVQKIYSDVFEKRSQKNILDYWALYFRTIVEPAGAYKNYLAAQVFLYAPDKRYNLILEYNDNLPIEDELHYAQNDEEKAAIHLMRAIQKPDKALKDIQTIYALTANSQALDFLLLREINKLEDWIYTTYYTRFNPAVIDWMTFDRNKTANERIKADRDYARLLYAFVATAPLEKVQDKILWQCSKAYLLAMTEQYQAALNEIALLEKQSGIRPAIKDKINQIKALCSVSIQKVGEAVIPDLVKAVLLYQHRKGNTQFVFSIARELEFKGNTTTAALLLSTINQEGNSWKNHIFWRSKSGIQTLNLDYYYSYFFYLDAEYTSSQLEALIHDVALEHPTDEFNVWLYQSIENDLNRLRDLLGTKLVRKNELQKALAAFKTVDPKLYKEEPFVTYLDANPFYTNFYNEHAPTKADTIRYDKTTLTQQLIEYIQLAEDPSSGKADYYNFLVANCYFNMTQYGNSWMMRRYYWSHYIKDSGLDDDEEYFGCVLAREYYLKAKAASKSEKFKALCLRMAARCEEYRLKRLHYKSRYEKEYYARTVYENNPYFIQLKQDFPQDYETIQGNCLSFDTYFNARN